MFNKRCAVVLACVTTAFTWAQSSATLEQRLRSKYALTSVSADNSSFVVTGSVLTLRVRPLAAGATTNAITSTDIYRDGKLASDAQGAVARASKSSWVDALTSRVPGAATINNHVANAGAFKDFVQGETLYVTQIFADPVRSKVEFDLISDVQADGRRYKAILIFPFSGSADFSRAESVISQVFVVASPPEPVDVRPTAAEAAPGNSDVPPSQVSEGQTIDQIVATLGQPVKTAKVGARVIYFYKDLKVTFENGMVSDIQ
jgi:hypothetical protein